MKFGYFVDDNPTLASYRYRIDIPRRHGVPLVSAWDDRRYDLALFGKHIHTGGSVASSQSPLVLALFRVQRLGIPVVADICDDHFDDPYGDYYRMLCEVAQTVVCSTQALADVIRQETGREATVIEDPYEWPEVAPRHGGGNRVFWFGHLNNAIALAHEVERLEGFDLYAVGNAPGCVPYSVEAMQRGFESCDAVMIPTLPDRKWQCKSANRMVESIRQGRFVVAHDMPAYRGLGMWIGGIRDGLEWARQNPDEAKGRVRQAQETVRRRFDPALIAEQWMTVFRGL